MTGERRGGNVYKIVPAAPKVVRFAGRKKRSQGSENFALGRGNGRLIREQAEGRERDSWPALTAGNSTSGE